MLDTARTLYSFYSSFGIPAYTTDNVPDDVQLPYLTYSLVDGDWETPRSHYCVIYMRTRSNADLLAKAREIKDRIGLGLILKCGEHGYLALHYENSDIVSSAASGAESSRDSEVRSIYINLQLDILHL